MDIIYIESGIFLFTKIGLKLIFEAFNGITTDNIFTAFRKIWEALKINWVLLIGIQGLMKKVNIGPKMFFNMGRVQNANSADREITYTYEKSPFSKAVLYTIKQTKPTYSFAHFLELAIKSGFKNIQSL